MDGLEEGQATDPIDFSKHEAEIIAYLATKGKETLTAAEKQQQIDAAVGNTHTAWETKIAEVLGDAKPVGVKGLEWAGEKIKTLKTPVVETVEQPVTPVVETPAGTNVEKALLEAMRKELEDLKKSQTDKEVATKSNAVKMGLNTILKNIDFGTEDQVEITKRQASAGTLISNGYKLDTDEYGTIIAIDPSGTIVVDTTTMKPKTIDAIVKEEFPFLFAEKKTPKPAGSGTQPNEVIITDGKKGVKALNTTQVIEKMRALGMVPGSPESRAFFQESCRISNLDPAK